MRRLSERWLVVALLFVTAAYAVAEDITLTTYYPSPRGVYREVQWGTNAAARLSADQGAAIELRGTGTPYIDFSNDAVADFDMRMILPGNGLLNVDGGSLAVTGGNLSASGSVSASSASITGDVSAGSVTLSAVTHTEWPTRVGMFTSAWFWNGGPNILDVRNGQASSLIKASAWVNCVWEDDATNQFRRTDGPAGSSCNARYWPDTDPNPEATSGEWRIFAGCPDGWKILAGGGAAMGRDSRKPHRMQGNEPTTYAEFNAATASSDTASNPARPAETEGWMIHAPNSSGYDLVRVYASCGDTTP